MAKRRNAKPPPKPKPSASEQLDRKLAHAALEKKQRGELPGRDERAALRRIEQQREEDQRWDYYRTIPKKHWREMADRGAQIINDQAKLYGIPFDGVHSKGRTAISLPDVVKALHDFLAENAPVLAQKDAAKKRAAPGFVTESEAKRRRAVAQAERERIRADREAGEVIPVTEAAEQRHAYLRWFMAFLDRLPGEIQAITRDRKTAPKVAALVRRTRQEAADRAK